MAVIHIQTNIESRAPKTAAYVLPPARPPGANRGRSNRRLRLSTVARRYGLNPRRDAIIAQRNGRFVLQRDWRRTLIGKNDVVRFCILPGNSQTLRTVALLAVVVVSAFVAPWLSTSVLGLTGIAATAATAGFTAALSLAGSYAINALLPLPQQSPIGVGASAYNSDTEAPTYAFTLSSQQNVARLGGAVPEWFGWHRVVPDLAATAWWEYENGKQIFRQTLCLSNGEVDVEKIELGRTPISSFEEIDTKIVVPGGAADLFEPEVYQSPDVSSIPVSAPNDLVAPDDGIYGPFAATPPGQETRDIGIDVAFPRGAYLQGSGGALTPKSFQWRVEARLIDDADAPLGSWFTVAEETFNANPSATNSSTPEAGITGLLLPGAYASTSKLNSQLSLSYRYTLADSGRYQVRMRRIDNKDTSTLAGHELAWTGLRGFLGGDGVYGDVTILQVEITATASVSSRSARQIAVTGTRKLPIYDTVTKVWSEPQPTRSIAAAAAYVYRSSNGGALADKNIDLEALFTLDATWQERGDYFDYYASAQNDCWEFGKTVLRCGRAVPYRQADMVRFHRDAPQTVPVTGFSRENIVQRTMKINYRTPAPDDEFDGFEIRYFDNRTWNFNTLRKAFYGTDAPLRPKRLPADGMTGIAHVQRELDYLVEEFNRRPISLSFDTEMEGFYPSYGDMVLVAHDSPEWGQANRVIAWDAEELAVDLIRPPIWEFSPPSESDDGWFVRVRDKRGIYSAQVLVVASPTPTRIILAEAPVYASGAPFPIADIPQTEFLHVMFGHATDAPRNVLVREITPREGGRTCTMQVVIEDPDVHVN